LLRKITLPEWKALVDLLSSLEDIPEELISGRGCVISTLEASIWCLIETKSYADAVLKAVNLGDDTDTTASVTGGLAGYYML